MEYSEIEKKKLEDCKICPHECRVNRLQGEKGRCDTGSAPWISSSNLHYGEEPPISGEKGSGTIFFTNCNLSCVYCQNYPISQLGNGNKETLDSLSDKMIKLKQRGAHNINFVTPTHNAVAIHRCLNELEGDLEIPVVYNSSGYDKVETLKFLDGLVDIYLVDMRYGGDANAEKYSKAEDYVEVNKNAIKEMYRQVGDLEIDNQGIGKSGIVIRHLVLPGGISESKKILKFISEEISEDTYISLMSQYFPAHKAVDIDPLSRRLHREEYEEVLEYLDEYNLKRGWIQDYKGLVF